MFRTFFRDFENYHDAGVLGEEKTDFVYTRKGKVYMIRKTREDMQWLLNLQYALDIITRILWFLALAVFIGATISYALRG